MDAITLSEKARKHKKWFEEVLINPFGYEVGGVLYYLSIYKKKFKS
jgi:hypothetical protein